MNRRVFALALAGWLLAAGRLPAQEGGGGGSGGGMAADHRSANARLYEDIEILRRLLLAKISPLVPPGLQPGDPYSQPGNWFYQPNGFGGGTLGLGGGGGGGFGVAGISGGGGFAGNNSMNALGGPSGGLGALGSGGLSNTLAGTAEFRNIYNPNAGGFSGQGGWWVNRRIDLEGVYLKGQGVVYTVTLPRTFALRSEPAPSPPRPLTEWERVRREVRNEKPAAQPRPTRAKGPGLADVILKVLAENGRHLRQLGEEERITVVVTLRGGGSGGRPSGPLAVFQAGGSGGGMGGASGGGPAGGPKAAMGGGGGGTSVRDYELLGDLQLKQGNAEAALAQYRKALEQKPDGPAAAKLWRKMAQALLAQGKDAEARKALNNLEELLKKPAHPVSKNTQIAGGARLPSKLIVSASKQLLDQVGSGKMTFEDFTKAAKVEVLTFPAQP